MNKETDEIKKSFDLDIELNDEVKRKCLTALSDENIKKLGDKNSLNIVGLEEIVLTWKIDCLDRTCLGKMELINSDPTKYRISLNLHQIAQNIKPEYILNTCIGTLIHELAHVHDHNAIPQYYEYCGKFVGSWDIEKMFLHFTIRIWAEFYASHNSATYTRPEIVDLKITEINQLYEKIKVLNDHKEQKVKAKLDILEKLAYLLGDIASGRFTIENCSNKISLENIKPMLTKLNDELNYLLNIYPKWENVSILDNLNRLITDFLCEDFRLDE